MATRWLAALALGLLIVGCGTGGTVGTDPRPAASPTVPPLHPSVDDYPETVVTLAGPRGARRDVAVKVADRPERRQHGLMEVEELPAGAGMLFVFPGDRRGAFWMRDTLVALDIAFAASDGEVLEILRMEPCERDPCRRYDPGVTYRYALEVPAGWFAGAGVDTGWTLDGPLPTAAG